MYTGVQEFSSAAQSLWSIVNGDGENKKSLLVLRQQVKEYSPVPGLSCVSMKARVNMSELRRDIRGRLREGKRGEMLMCWRRAGAHFQIRHDIGSWHETEVCGCRNILLDEETSVILQEPRCIKIFAQNCTLTFICTLIAKVQRFLKLTVKRPSFYPYCHALVVFLITKFTDDRICSTFGT